jgi:hypothetical protein
MTDQDATSGFVPIVAVNGLPFFIVTFLFHSTRIPSASLSRLYSIAASSFSVSLDVHLRIESALFFLA